ncbi:HD domain-containing protein [Planctomycetota bacterium]
MNHILQIPEVRSLDGCSGLVRIPPDVDIPLTDRVRKIVDSVPFRRLATISQLGLVSRVYPAANHSRFEHSLGVYRTSLLFLKQLSRVPDFEDIVTREDGEVLILTALLHDIGHWPHCHPIEDMHLDGVPTHEQYARRYIVSGPIADVIQNEWGISPDRIVGLLEGRADSASSKILRSVLSGPIDVDKMDYLMRDSLHAGVPYGRNFDQARLISSICLNENRDGLAITEKGRTAAEMMVFARYVMFSEVYWHHAVRSSTAMLQRAFYEGRSECDLDLLFQMSDFEFVDELAKRSNDQTGSLLDGLFGHERRLYKRLAQFSYIDDRETYDLLARRPYEWLVHCGRRLASELSHASGKAISDEQVLIDAPPTKLEVQFDLDVYYAKSARFRTLGEVSPVVRTLAETQFDRIVKRVRVFVHPSVKETLRDDIDLTKLIRRAAS